MASDFIFLIPVLIVNSITIWFFWKKRSESPQAKRTVEKYAKNLLFISIGDTGCHALWTTIDLSLSV